MADNTFNFDLDAPAVPTLTLDPVEAPAAEEKQPEPAAAPEAEQVKLSPEEQAMVDAFAQKIDITNSQQVLQYGSACQKKIGDFSEAALSKVSTKDLGEVGGMITDLIGELKNFDAAEEEKGILGFFKKKGNQLDNMKTKYSKAETNVETSFQSCHGRPSAAESSWMLETPGYTRAGMPSTRSGVSRPDAPE